MIGSFLSLKQTLMTFNKVLGKIEDAGDGKIDINRREAMLLNTKGSMIKLLSTFIIEPTIVISKDLRENEVTEKLAEINLDVFASFYIQAFNVMTNVYGFDQQTSFDILSSKGSLGSRKNYGKTDVFSLESMDLLSLENMDTLPILSMEANDRVRPLVGKKMSANEYITKLEEKNVKLQKAKDDAEKKLADEGPKDLKLTQGRATITENKGTIVPTLLQKNIEITFTVSNPGKTMDGKKAIATREIVVPILIKATVIYSDFNNIETMIDTNGRDKKYGSRLDEYKAGLISLSDLIFADDLVAQYKKNKFKDKDDLISYMEGRATAANKKMITKGAVGFGKYYSVLILTKREASIIENKLGGSIDKPKYKERLMEQTKSLLVNIVDPDWERVTMYTKDLRGTSDLSFKVIKKRKGDGNTSELAEVFKALSSNRPPVF